MKTSTVSDDNLLAHPDLLVGDEDVMIGLYFFFLLGCWLFFVAWLSTVIARRIPAKRWRPLVGGGLFLIVVPMLFIDEIVGKYQFEELCRKNSEVYIAPDAKGRTVYLADTPVEMVQGSWVDISLQPWLYIDSTSNKVVVDYKSFNARGGWFVHAFFGEAGPLVFKGFCRPTNPPVNVKMFKRLGIIRINRPKKYQGASE